MAKHSPESGLKCPFCGYNLKSLTSSRCPECGKPFVVSAPETAEKKTVMRSLGEFLGHIVKGLRTDPSRKVIRKDVQEERREDGVILRRTTIEEVEINREGRNKAS